MSEKDRIRWDERYRRAGEPGDIDGPAAPACFVTFEDIFPTSGSALDLACGRGGASVWLARRGMSVAAFDVSEAALEHARRLAESYRVADRCRFSAADLDDGLPPGPPVDLVVCHMFRDPRLYRPMAERLRAGGLLAIAVLSEVGAESGPFRAPSGELVSAFADLSVVTKGEAGGRAWLLGRRR